MSRAAVEEAMGGFDLSAQTNAGTPTSYKTADEAFVASYRKRHGFSPYFPNGGIIGRNTKAERLAFMDGWNARGANVSA